jgi:hypothetical protein
MIGKSSLWIEVCMYDGNDVENIEIYIQIPDTSNNSKKNENNDDSERMLERLNRELVQIDGRPLSTIKKRQ